jgi:hypothetical protein
MDHNRRVVVVLTAVLFVSVSLLLLLLLKKKESTQRRPWIRAENGKRWDTYYIHLLNDEVRGGAQFKGDLRLTPALFRYVVDAIRGDIEYRYGMVLQNLPKCEVGLGRSEFVVFPGHRVVVWLCIPRFLNKYCYVDMQRSKAHR